MSEEARSATLFYYRYRDAGNFKAFGHVVLEGQFTISEQQRLRECLDSGEYFIAEQVRIPTLYEQLYQLSGGSTYCDHCWHEFVVLSHLELRDVPTESFVWGKAADLLNLFCSIHQWDGTLSPHFWIPANYSLSPNTIS